MLKLVQFQHNSLLLKCMTNAQSQPTATTPTNLQFIEWHAAALKPLLSIEVIEHTIVGRSNKLTVVSCRQSVARRVRTLQWFQEVVVGGVNLRLLSRSFGCGRWGEKNGAASEDRAERTHYFGRQAGSKNHKWHPRRPEIQSNRPLPRSFCWMQVRGSGGQVQSGVCWNWGNSLSRCTLQVVPF